MKKTFFLALFMLYFCSMQTFAQVTLKLDNGKTFVIEGAKETYKDNKTIFYVKHAKDTVYFYEYDARFFLKETRIPLVFFNKANTKNSGAKVKFYDAKKYANTKHFVGFQCAKDGDNMIKGFTNDFILIKYENQENPNTPPNITKICSVNVYFSMAQEKEAKIFLKNVEDNIKNLK